MSKAQVKKVETGKVLKDDDLDLDNVAGLYSLIAYIFADDKLVRTRYVFMKIILMILII